MHLWQRARSSRIPTADVGQGQEFDRILPTENDDERTILSSRSSVVKRLHSLLPDG